MEASQRSGWLILGATGAALLLLLGWYLGERSGPAGPVSATVVVTYSPDADVLFNRSVDLPEGEGTPLGALLEAGRLAGFEVEVSGAFWEPFVTSVGGHANEGACGWVYDVNGVRPLVGAGSYALAEGDAVDWYWDCADGSP